MHPPLLTCQPPLLLSTPQTLPTPVLSHANTTRLAVVLFDLKLLQGTSESIRSERVLKVTERTRKRLRGRLGNMRKRFLVDPTRRRRHPRQIPTTGLNLL